MSVDLRWTPEDARIASDEGWGIFFVDHEGHPPYELQADYEAGVFLDGNSADDGAAVEFVVSHAESGSEFHRRALLFIRDNAPDEARHWADQGMWPLEFAP